MRGNGRHRPLFFGGADGTGWKSLAGKKTGRGGIESREGRIHITSSMCMSVPKVPAFLTCLTHLTQAKVDSGASSYLVTTCLPTNQPSTSIDRHNHSDSNLDLAPSLLLIHSLATLNLQLLIPQAPAFVSPTNHLNHLKSLSEL